jgi:hypothetical protein
MVLSARSLLSLNGREEIAVLPAAEKLSFVLGRGSSVPSLFKQPNILTFILTISAPSLAL